MPIPKNIFQSWKSKDLPEGMKKASQEVQRLNPGYTYIFHDDTDCRNVILEGMGKKYALAFDTLIPGAFKCDFWRYIVLYLFGGFYLDLDMIPLVSFDYFGDEYSFISASDQKNFLAPTCAIFQAFLASEAGHPAMKYAIDITFYNISTRRTEVFDNFSISGPVVMGVAVNLFLDKDNTMEESKPGIYKKNSENGQNGDLLLLKFEDSVIYGPEGRSLIMNKYEGYSRGSSNYATTDPYSNDPRSKAKKTAKKILIGLGILMIVFLVFLLVYRSSWKSCKKDCKESCVKECKLSNNKSENSR